MTALIIIAAIIAVFAVLLAIPVSCEIYFRYNDEVEADFALKYGFIRLGLPKRKGKAEEPNREKPKAADSANKETGKRGIPRRLVIEFVRENAAAVKELIYAALGYMFKRLIRIDRLKIKLVLGLDDAMQTALVYGAAAGFIFNVLGIMDKEMRLGRHTTEVKPAFNNPHIFAETEAKISTSIGRVLMLGIIVMRHALPLLIKVKRLRNGKEK